MGLVSSRALARAVVLASACASLLIAAAGRAHAQLVPFHIDVGPNNADADAPPFLPVISFDGHFVAFVSAASNLAPGDTDGAADFFRFDWHTGTLTRRDIPIPLGAGEYPHLVAISHDGRWLLFDDLRGDWVAGDTNGAFDVFLLDFTTGAVRRVSVGAGGVEANGGSFATSMSLDARYVAFDSWATNLAPAALDNGRDMDVFVRDTVADTTIQVSRGTGGLPANGASSGARISPDGEWVAFSSHATNLVAGDWSVLSDVYLAHWPTGGMFRATPPGVEPDGESFAASVSWGGAFVAVESLATNLAPGPSSPGLDTFVWDRLGGSFRAVASPAPNAALSDIGPAALSLYGHFLARTRVDAQGHRVLQFVDFELNQIATLVRDVEGTFASSLDGRYLVYIKAGNLYAQPYRSPGEGLVPIGDADGDGLSNDWEQRVGLSAESGAGDDGPDGDPDHDGATNLEELQAGTHPRGFHTRYLAEGAENAFFATRVALLNPTGTAAHVRVAFLRDRGAPLAEIVEVPAHARRTVLGRAVEGLPGQSFSVSVEADAAVVVDRTMLWDRDAYGGHSETAVAAPSTTWYLAEGSTAGAFDLFYLLENPNPVRADVTVTWMLPPPLAPVVHTYALPPESRTTLYVDTADVRLASTDAAAVFDATQPIFVERAMYYSRPGQPFAAGHAASGVPAPSTRWFLAEGATGAFFETFLLLLNPSPQPAACEIQYLTAGGTILTKAYVLPPASRTTIWVDAEEIPGLGRALANASFSTLVTSTSGVPIVVERAMWWPDGDWQEAHASAGATVTGPRWAFADGDNLQARTYVLVANTSAAAGDARVTLFFEDGTTVARVHPIAAHSRATVDPAADVPDSAGRRFGVLVEGLGATPPDLVVERATYWNANGLFWAGGTGALATPLP
jgi:hypothetical protein